MSQFVMNIRAATRHDVSALARMGATNGRFRPPRALVAQDGHEIIAAIDLTSGAVVADQACSTPDVMDALRRSRYALLRQGGSVRHARFALAPRGHQPNGAGGRRAVRGPSHEPKENTTRRHWA